MTMQLQDEQSQAQRTSRDNRVRFSRFDLTRTKSGQTTAEVTLELDGKTEKFIGNDAANAMLTRNYRAPYIVPEKI